MLWSCSLPGLGIQYGDVIEYYRCFHSFRSEKGRLNAAGLWIKISEGDLFGYGHTYVLLIIK